MRQANREHPFENIDALLKGDAKVLAVCPEICLSFNVIALQFGFPGVPLPDFGAWELDSGR